MSSSLNVTAAKLAAEYKLKNRAVLAVNVILMEHAESYLKAAEEMQIPLIMQISENAIKYHGSLKPIFLATQAIANGSQTPICVHLDHIEDINLIKEGLDLGCKSIMYDGSKLDYSENVKISSQIAELVHSYRGSLEVELGEIGGKDGVHAPGARTNPLEAKKFVEDTNADLLAVAVGSSHAMNTRDAKLNFELIKEISHEVPVPLVLHGSSGVSDEDLLEAVKSGISKVNIATHLNKVFTNQIRNQLSGDPKLSDPRKYLIPAKEVVKEEVKRLLKLVSN